MKFKLIGTPLLKGCKVGFHYKGSVDIFVSPSVVKLASSDLKLLYTLRVFRIGQKTQRAGIDLETYVLHASKQHDIFGGERNEPGNE
jgi:hypothetical protein